MKTPKAVVFDMDGVLSDSEWIYAEKILEVLREEGTYIEADEINDLFGQSMLNICIELKKRYHLSEQAKYYAERVHYLRDKLIEKEGLFAGSRSRRLYSGRGFIQWCSCCKSSRNVLHCICSPKGSSAGCKYSR